VPPPEVGRAVLRLPLARVGTAVPAPTQAAALSGRARAPGTVDSLLLSGWSRLRSFADVGAGRRSRSDLQAGLVSIDSEHPDRARSAHPLFRHAPFARAGKRAVMVGNRRGDADVHSCLRATRDAALATLAGL